MDSKEFKKVFDEIAKENGFEKAFGGWFKKSNDCIAVLELQKSNFGDNYYLNIKVFIQGAFEKIYSPSKDLIKSSMGHITNQIRDKDVLDFDTSMADDKRREKLESLFSEFIIPFTNKTLKREGIKELDQRGELFLLPAVKKELNI